ncbi:MAG: OmpA family protein [Endomicrobia bacterium]|nr:OmpA family protein [Endomicrobiia bacterium]
MKKLLLIITAFMFLFGVKTYADDVYIFTDFETYFTNGTPKSLELKGNITFAYGLSAGLGLKEIIGGGFTLDGVNTSSGLRVLNNNSFTVTGPITFQNFVNVASSGGAVFLQNSSAAFNGSVDFVNNISSFSGGAIYSSASYINFDVLNGSIVFRENSANRRASATGGGAVYAVQSTMNFSAANGNIIFDLNVSNDEYVFSNTLGGGAVYTRQSKMDFEVSNGNILFSENSINRRNGYSGGGAVFASQSTMSFKATDGNIIFNSNAASAPLNYDESGGGAIYASASKMDFNVLRGSIVFESNNIGVNWYDAEGGGIRASGSRISFSAEDGDIVFRSNIGRGALYVNNSSANFVVSNGNIIFDSNIGGGIYLIGTSEVTLSVENGKIIFDSNTGSAVRAASFPSGNIIYFDGIAEFTSNTANALYLTQKETTFNHEVSFTGNNATGGGGSLQPDSGGAIFILADTKYTFNSTSTFTGNIAYGSSQTYVNTGGGAIYLLRSSSVFNGKTSFINNVSSTVGGAVYSSNSYVSFTGKETNFIGNRAETINGNHGYGGAIYAGGASTVSFNVTGGTISFVLNTSTSSSYGGGAIYASASQVNFDTTYSLLLFSSNSANSSMSRGGAINAQTQSTITFKAADGDIIFNANESGGYGGAIYANNSRLNFDVERGSIIFSLNWAGSQGGAIEVSGSTMTFKVTDGNILFDSNRNQYLGGAIYAGTRSSMTFSSLRGDIIFSSNSTTGGGGALYVTGSTISFSAENGDIIFSSNSTTGNNGGALNAQSAALINFSAIGGNIVFSSNVAQYLFVMSSTRNGGAVYVSGGSTISFSATGGKIIFSSNIAGINYAGIQSGNGGAIYAMAASNIEFDGEVIFTLNRALTSGGAIYSLANQKYVFTDTVTFTNNAAGVKGGAVYLGGNANIDFGSAKFYAIENMAGFGGFLFSTGTKTIDMTWNNITITGNYADYGGTLFAEDGTLFRFNGLRTDMSMTNSTAAYGGIIGLGVNGGADFSNTVLYAENNIAETGGGFMYVAGGTATFNEANITNNTAGSYGGAIYVGAGSLVTAKNIVLSGNEAGMKGGAVYMEGEDGNAAVMNITPTVNMVVDGNTAGVTPNSFHLEEYAELNLAIGSGLTMTIKDGITSGSNNTEITKTGAGLLLLDSANNGIDGRLNIYGGIVRTGNEIGAGDIYFNNNGKLNITDSIDMQSNLYALSGSSVIDLEINNGKTITMEGVAGDGKGGLLLNGGKLVMTVGSSADLGTAIINSGAMEILTENFGASQLTVNANTVLSGNGKIVGNVTNNGTLRAGEASGQGANEFGRLTITGDYTENGILRIRLNEGVLGSLIDPMNDKLIVGGNATINAGSQIYLDMSNGFEIYKEYTVLEATGVVSGLYSGLAKLYPSFNIKIGSEDGKKVIVYLSDVETDYVEIPGLDHNNLEVAKIIDKVTAGGDADKINDISKIIGTMDSLDDMGKRRVMEEVSGSIYANALLMSGKQMRQAYHRILDRRESGYEGYNAWAGIYGSQMKMEQDSNSGDFKARNGYMIMGLEKYSDSSNFMMGYYLSGGQHDTHQWDDIVDIKDYRGGLYLGKFIDKWTIRGELSGGYQQYKGQRVQKLLQSRAESEYDGWNINANVEAFYKVYESEAFNLSPFAGLDGSFIRTSGFKEKGYGNAAAVLTVKDNQFEIMNALAGIRAEKEVGILRWYGELGARYNLRGSKGQFKATLNNLVDEEMTILGAGNSLLSGKAELGFSADIWKEVEIFAMGSYEKAERFNQAVGEIGLGYRFGNAKKGILEKTAVKAREEAYKNNEEAQDALKEALEAAARAEQYAKEAESATTIESSKEAARLAKEEAKKAEAAADKAWKAAQLAKEAAEKAAIAAKETDGLTKTEKDLRESRARLAAAKAKEAAEKAEEAAQLAKEAAARAGKFSEEAKESSIKVEKEITMFREKEKSKEIELIEVKGKPKAKGFRLTRALFDFDKFDLTPDAKEAVGGMARALRELDYEKVTIEGHTDEVGDDNYNEALSKRRANTVEKKLVELGIDADKIETVGYGKTKPIESNKTAEGRAKNRRVEIIVE